MNIIVGKIVIKNKFFIEFNVVGIFMIIVLSIILIFIVECVSFIICKDFNGVIMMKSFDSEIILFSDV